MNYNDELCERSERISENLRIRIRSIVKNPKKHNDWDEVVDDIISRFYPNLSKAERTACRCIVDAGRDLHGDRLPCEEIEARLPIYNEFFSKRHRMKNIILLLCNKGAVKWMTNIHIERYRNGKVFRVVKYETYSMNPEIIHHIATRAYVEILRLQTEKEYEGCFPVKYKKYLTWINFPREYHPILN
jgi:hypothetical protein